MKNKIIIFQILLILVVLISTTINCFYHETMETNMLIFSTGINIMVLIAVFSLELIQVIKDKKLNININGDIINTSDPNLAKSIKDYKDQVKK